MFFLHKNSLLLNILEQNELLVKWTSCCSFFLEKSLKIFPSRSISPECKLFFLFFLKKLKILLISFFKPSLHKTQWINQSELKHTQRETHTLTTTILQLAILLYIKYGSFFSLSRLNWKLICTFSPSKTTAIYIPFLFLCFSPLFWILKQIFRTAFTAEQRNSSKN